MKYQIPVLALCSLFSFFPLSSEALITDSNDIGHAITYYAEDTLFAFDLDNTLIAPSQHLGSDEWFTHHLDELMNKEGMHRNDAVQKILPVYVEVLRRTDMSLVDASIPELLEKMKKKNIPMIGLTKRDPSLSDITLKQISSLNIDFSSTSHVKEDHVFEEAGGTLYKNGVIFVGQGMNKGPALLAFLKKLNKMPKRIVVIDDKLSHIENIASVVEPLGIDFIGIRYGKADEKVKAFDPKIAKKQLEHFHRILSDEQAMHLLKLSD